MLEAIFAIIIGFIIMIYSADWFVQGAASLADHWGMSKLMIGLTIVAFGTSAPEIIVSLLAALEGSAEIAVGNALGSNLANIGMVLGITAFVTPIAVSKSLVKTEIPILVAVYVIAGIFLYDANISSFESTMLTLALALFMLYLFIKQRSHNAITADDGIHDAEDDEVGELIGLSLPKSFIALFCGLALLLVSAKILVWGAINLATLFGIPELIIGLTVVAIGTSLPELAASIASARRGHHEIAFGNVIGSNIFNILVVMSIPGFVGSQSLDAAVFSRDFIAMIIISGIWIAFMALCVIRKQLFNRLMGAVLLLSYGAYYVVLAQSL
ncbi:MAG: calcium/sodium antiporter [Sinobacterium sp.]|nr:calcium/sodium antiporter [Sinobacterium sp.]